MTADSQVKGVTNVANAREQLASQLKQARINAGYASQAGFAKKLRVSRPLVSKAESPSQPVPSDALLITWADVTSASAERLAEWTDLAARAKSGIPEWFMSYLAAEQEATLVRCWGPDIVPGLLQAECYARPVLSVEATSPEQLDALVKTRVDRQKILDRNDLHVIAIIAARVFREEIGSPRVMADQCTHLVAVAERPNVSLYVVPDGVNCGAWGALDIAARGAIVTVNMSTALDDVPTTAPDVIDRAMRTFERVLGCAMGVGESLEFLRRMESEWKSRI